MTEPAAPDVDCSQQHAALRVSDVAEAVGFTNQVWSVAEIVGLLG